MPLPRLCDVMSIAALVLFCITEHPALGVVAVIYSCTALILAEIRKGRR